MLLVSHLITSSLDVTTIGRVLEDRILHGFHEFAQGYRLTGCLEDVFRVEGVCQDGNLTQGPSTDPETSLGQQP